MAGNIYYRNYYSLQLADIFCYSVYSNKGRNNLHKLQKFMQIKLKKYFIIIRSATVGLHQWEREEEHLDHIKRIASTQARRRNHCCVRKSLKHAALFQCPPSGALNFSNLSPFFVCHA